MIPIMILCCHYYLPATFTLTNTDCPALGGAVAAPAGTTPAAEDKPAPAAAFL